jgi:predicted nucleotidyltransferase
MTTSPSPEMMELSDLFANEPVVVAYLFGSQARGDAGPLSDVDVAVLVEGDNILVHEYLQVDRDLVYLYLQHNLDDMKDFAQEVIQFVRSWQAGEVKRG